jgi:hypothetical protein
VGYVYIRKATDPQGDIVDDVYYVGSTSDISRRYRKSMREKCKLVAFPTGFESHYCYEQGIISYLRSLGVPLSNKQKAFKFDYPIINIKINNPEIIEYCNSLGGVDR